MLVAGVDSSTQSTKVVLCRATDGEVVGSGSAPHPAGTECHPDAWWAALLRAGAGLLDRADAIGVAGQQHGMIVLDQAGQVVRPALLWNDLRSAAAAADLVGACGGPGWWAAHTGSVPTASFTVAKLRWLAEHEPASAERAAAVLLPHDWLSWRLRFADAGPALRSAGAGPGAQSGGAGPGPWSGDAVGAGLPVAEATTDRGDASGTGYFDPTAGTWLPDLAAAAFGRRLWLPRVARPAEVVGETPWGAAMSAGTGDNMAAALGLGLEPGDVAVSIGTSGTVFAVSQAASADPSGAVAGFADATGRFLPLVCTVNAALVLAATAALLGTDAGGLSALALAGPSGAGGITLLPYLDGERTPDRPNATGVLRGLTTRNATRENLARAAVEAVLASLADAADLLAERGAAGAALTWPETCGPGAAGPAVAMRGSGGTGSGGPGSGGTGSGGPGPGGRGPGGPGPGGRGPGGAGSGGPGSAGPGPGGAGPGGPGSGGPGSGGPGAAPRRVLLIGGAARSEAVRRIAPGIFGTQVLVPEPAEYVALGAARQAAWALAGTAEPPRWPPRLPATQYTGSAQPGIRDRHAALRDDAAAFQEGTRQ